MISGSTEERLRRALAQHAQTTTTAPDSWPRIRARIAPNGHGQGPRRVRWAILAPAAAVGVVGLILLVSLAGHDGDGVVRVTGGPERLYLAPTGVDGRFRLSGADTDPQTSSQPGGIFRAFGRRGPDSVALQASAVITVPSDFALVGAEPEPAPLRVLGRDVAVSRDDFGRRILAWSQADGQTVGVMTSDLSEGELAALAESLIGGDATKDVPTLPTGFTPVHSGPLPGGPPRVSFQNWEADDGDSFNVSVNEVPGVTIDDLAWYLPGGRATTVRGRTAIYSDRRDADLVWIERPGTVVTVHAIGVSENDLVALAEGLRPVDEAAWNDLRARALRPSGSPPSAILDSLGTPKVLTPANSYFVVAPVDGQSIPPCRPDPSAPSAAVVAGKVGDQEVTCYRLGPAQIAADDVSTATARQSRATEGWEVEFTLSTEGAARFEALLRAVGAGGQVAILVDGRLVSAPRVSSPSAAPNGVVTGLDEQTARRLADRLKP